MIGVIGQRVAVSATFPYTVRPAVKAFMGGRYERVGPGWDDDDSTVAPEVDVVPTLKPPSLIEQRSVRVDGDKRVDLLSHILQEEDDWGKVLVFTAKKVDTEDIARALRKGGVKAEGLNGDLSQGGREVRIETQWLLVPTQLL